jgi:hypothetical protein
MKKLIVSLLLTFTTTLIFGQVIFNGFDQPQCGLYSNNPYSFYNGLDCVLAAGYEVFKNNSLVWSYCPENDGCFIYQFLVTSDTSVFYVHNCNAYGPTRAFKTTNSFGDVLTIGSGAPSGYLGYYLLSPNAGYLITHVNEALFIARASDIQTKQFHDWVMDNDTVFYDSIIGEPYCEIDTLGFVVSYQGNPVNYSIVFNSVPVNVESQTISDGITIFPNPAKVYFKLNFKNIPINTSMEILNNHGKTVKRDILVPDKKYYIGDLPRGLYLLKIKQMSNVVHKKLIVN